MDYPKDVSETTTWTILKKKLGSLPFPIIHKINYRPVLSNRIFFDDGHILHLYCSTWQPLATCGYWALEIELLH